MAKEIRVGIVGATGYTGLELVKILINHPAFELTYIANSEGETTIDQLHPSLRSVCEMAVEKADPQAIAQKCELVFLAVPHMTAMAFVKPLMELGVKVVDLSADYRLPRDIYEAFYQPHSDPENLLKVSMDFLRCLPNRSKPLHWSQTLAVFQPLLFWDCSRLWKSASQIHLLS